MGNTEQNDDSMVYSLDSKPFGLTYGDWTVEWWQWILSMPENINPLFDMTGERSNINQTKQVWFLAGTYQGEAQRTCTIPAGRAILFPVINIECSYTENPDIENDSELSASCKFLIDQVTKRTACLDGIILEDSSTVTNI
jgi:hypothetical protein